MLAGKKQTAPTVWAEFRNGFEVEIRYQTRADLRRLLDSAQAQSWDMTERKVVAKLDNNKFYRAMAETIIVNWRGLNAPVLKTLVLLDDYPESEVPYSVEDCVWLLQQAKGFDLWVQDVCAEVEAFQAVARAAELKN